MYFVGSKKSVTVKNFKNYFSFRNGDGNSCCEELEACGIPWEIEIYPCGLDRDSEHVAFQLRNMSSQYVDAKYSATIPCLYPQSPEEKYPEISPHWKWEDPEGMLRFHEVESGDNEWGCDEFIPHEILFDSSLGFYSENDNCVTFEFEIFTHTSKMAYIEDENLNHLIKKSAASSELLAYADADLSLVVNKLPKGGVCNAKEQLKLDKLFDNRLEAMTASQPITHSLSRHSTSLAFFNRGHSHHNLHSHSSDRGNSRGGSPSRR